MPIIHLTTQIKAPIQVVFELARSIDFHQESTAHTKERAISSLPDTKLQRSRSRTSGLIQLGETVTWEAVHFGIKQQLSSEITVMEQNRPLSDLIQRPSVLSSLAQKTLGAKLNSTEVSYFTDVMIKGAFKSIHHEHLFSEEDGVTTMVDLFHFEAPLGLLGKLANVLFLTHYMRKILHIRNEAIKKEAEKRSFEKWKHRKE